MDNGDSGLRVLQINVDRGKAATLLAERRFAREFDVACVQEPYARFRPTEDFHRHRSQNDDRKTEIWTRRNLDATTIQDLTTNNYVTIRIDTGGDEVLITSLYEEPGGPNCPRLDDLSGRLTDRRTRHVMATDMNAHNAAWGNEATDARGVEVLAWANAAEFTIWNEAEQGPTFQTVRGRSYIDLTMSRGVEVEGWTVDHEETLSGHKYLTYGIKTGRKGAGNGTKRYDFDNTDWDVFKNEVKRLTDATITEDMDVEQKAGRLQQACRRACQRKIARRDGTDGGDEDWFDDELKRLKTDTRRARREWQADKTDENRQTFVDKRNTYKKLIKTKKQDYMTRQIDDRVEHEPWHRVWGFVGKKRTVEPKKNYQKEDGQYTQTDDETNEYLLRKYFPDDRPDDDNEIRARIRQERRHYETGDEANFCLEELMHIAKALRKRKATPKKDRVPNEAVVHILGAIGETVTNIYRQCWDEGVFPKVWKDAEIVWLPKKDGTPRPISLLPTLGKLLDRLINRRLQQHLEREGELNDRQYAYRQGRGTIDALKNLIGKVEANKNQRKHQAVVALDLKNAFNSAWKPYIKRRMQAAKVDEKIARLCESFLEDRTVRSGNVEIGMKKGCPQGSSLGPTLWNLVMEGWFQAIDRENTEWREQKAEERGVNVEHVGDLAEYQAYADDQVVIVAGSSAREIEEKWRRVWVACQRWSGESNTRYNTDKTEGLFITKNGKRIRQPVIDTDGVRVELRESIKYLGVIIDRVLNFNEHLGMVKEKTMRVANRLVSITRRNYGNSRECLKIITERVAKPAVMYAQEIWGSKAGGANNRKILAAIQRPFLLAIARAYRTTATAALNVLVGIPPWWIEAQVNNGEHRRNLEHIRRARLDTAGIPSIAKMLGILRAPGCMRQGTRTINVDASGGRTTGIGVVTTTDGQTREKRYVIEERLNTGLAETIAILIGLRTIQGQTDVIVRTDRLTVVKKLHTGRPTNNYETELFRTIDRRWREGWTTKVEWVRRTDPGQVVANRAAREAHRLEAITVDLSDWTHKSRAQRRTERMEETKRRWQEEWDNGSKGRELHRHCGQVGLDMIRTTFKATQLLTGHGNTKAYIRRFNLGRTDGTCDCGREQETMEHIMYRCTNAQRQRIRQDILGRYGDLTLRLRDNDRVNEEQLTKLVLWAEEALTKEDWDGRRDRANDENDSDNDD